MKAIIVGGGIGGLTTALMLRARGIGCELFEQSDTIRELGVGINTLPHAIRELAGLACCKNSTTSRSAPTCFISQSPWPGSLARICGIDAGHDVPRFSIYRGRLQR